MVINTILHFIFNFGPGIVSRHSKTNKPQNDIQFNFLIRFSYQNQNITQFGIEIETETETEIEYRKPKQSKLEIFGKKNPIYKTYKSSFRFEI